MKALLGIPGIEKITFEHAITLKKFEHLDAMGEYMTKCLADSKSGSFVCILRYKS